MMAGNREKAGRNGQNTQAFQCEHVFTSAVLDGSPSASCCNHLSEFPYEDLLHVAAN
jgi:hypothetical protein